MDEAEEASSSVEFKKAARMRALTRMMDDPEAPTKGRFRDPADLFAKKSA